MERKVALAVALAITTAGCTGASASDANPDRVTGRHDSRSCTPSKALGRDDAAAAADPSPTYLLDLDDDGYGTCAHWAKPETGSPLWDSTAYVTVQVGETFEFFDPAGTGLVEDVRRVTELWSRDDSEAMLRASNGSRARETDDGLCSWRIGESGEFYVVCDLADFVADDNRVPSDPDTGVTAAAPATTAAPAPTEAPTTQAPTTEAPTTQAPTTVAPTTAAPTTAPPTTAAPTTVAPTTAPPATQPPTTPAPTTAAPGCTIRKHSASVLGCGDSGPYVRSLQEALASQGYRVTIDGYFGLQTELAVKSFQRDNFLTADGLAGPETIGLVGACQPGYCAD
ncbi:MAG: peptidoglycan-binding domain-containing protein [Ilumatobacteraceae bacterium]